MYLRLRLVEEACMTQEILDRHAGKTLQRMEEQEKRRTRERKEDGREERMSTRWLEAVPDSEAVPSGMG